MLSRKLAEQIAINMRAAAESLIYEMRKGIVRLR